ncbi:MAG TPA: T9SS type A sorting domain-containing protein, partial [Chitinophagales bacterium]|nr:T9SS type A sorting domain-containing protein [Chitinophagales bacterium]
IEREGLLRQDYSNGKVWRLFDSVEVLIYNFLALPGDTVEVFNTPGSSNTFVIDSVNMIVLNNGEARNRLYPRWVAGSYFSNFPLPLEWIEGIGSNAGLFRPSGGELVGASLWLSCFTQNDTVKYGDSCNVFLDVESLPNTISINIYPNPNNSTFKIQLPKHVVGTSHITVQNTIGQIVFHTTVESANGLVEVNLNNVTNGFYMITVRRDDGVYNAKLLIEK